ncbi:MAG TPA: hypothetical protein VLG50_08810 [Candidatus Saccharimonadales bacterium]|nr:hypothetical protein [Candidatus Saccharimonadales bacterium]
MRHSFSFKAWSMFRVTYALAPILVGLDKMMFTNFLVEWSKYVSPVVLQLLHLNLNHFLILVGVLEIVGGIMLWFYPRLGGYTVATLMGLVVINLLTMHMYYDIIVRDIIIMIGVIGFCWMTTTLENNNEV